tara:strand:+ start:446 stop:598 length:153 start_codon:yes stop_codon:yes gene_type:complete
MIDYLKQEKQLVFVTEVIELKKQVDHYKILVENLKQQLYFLNNKQNGNNN